MPPKKGTPNPMDNTYPASRPHVSKNIYPIAGIKTTVYGLDELPTKTTGVTCLWLLHPRLSKQEWMEPLAALAISEWNEQLKRNASSHQGQQGLIAVAFDQRNHGTRLVDELANEAWRDGNPKHAQDMFSCFHGTSLDTSQLITYLPAYAFPHDEHVVTSNMILGVSLGGYAAWHCIMHDPRISTAVVVIGCADYVRVMSHRAEKSKLRTWTSTDPPGSKFLGSKDFPRALMEAVEKYDPAGLLMGEMIPPGGSDHAREPTAREKQRLVPLMREHLGGKHLLVQCGGADKLVPYSASEPFLSWLKKAIGPNGWFSGQGTTLKEIVYDGVGHEMTPKMMRDALDYITETMSEKQRMASKI